MNEIYGTILVGIVIGLIIGLLIVDQLGYAIGLLFGSLMLSFLHVTEIKGGYSGNGVEIESPAITKTGGADSLPKNFLKRDIGAHKKIVHDIDNEYVKNGIMPILGHIEPDAENTTEFSRILDLSKQKKYDRRTGEYKPALHWGQLKLFLSEVEFLTKVYQLSGSKKKIWFVYAGSAPGDHIAYLHSLFPKIHFELYDPNNFIVKDTDMIKTHVQFFTDVDAKFWADHIKNNPDDILTFCTDIRTEPATLENIDRNMKMQLEWWKIMNPELSMFKFRLPWEPGKTEYPEGDIYIQAYPGPTSSETRLICKKDAKLILYDNIEYDDACFYHNSITRKKMFVNCKGFAFDKCYDCMSFEHIMQEYLSIVEKTNSSKSVMSLRQIIKEVESEITQGRNTIRSNTIRQILQLLDISYRKQFDTCGKVDCKICMSGYKSHERIKSRATIENEELQKLNL